jgi:hypothetical protein
VHVGGLTVLGAVRDVQVPLLSVLLLGGCAAKLNRAVAARSISAVLGPGAMFPLRLRGPVAMFMCVSELALGIGLAGTSGRFGAGPPANAVRIATALLFLTAAGALYEMRHRRPDAGCGCFGDLSDTPVGIRTIGRSAVLLAAAAASVGAPPLRMPSAMAQASLLVAVVFAEVAVIAMLSPELGEILIRLGYSEPCEVRRVPVERTLSTLRSSAAWRKHRRQITEAEPADVWREGCWRFVVYAGSSGERPADIIFAVYLHGRRPLVRTAALDARTGVPAQLTSAPARRVPVPGGAVLRAAVPRQRTGVIPAGHLAAPVPAADGTPPHQHKHQPEQPAASRRHAHHALAGRHRFSSDL